MARYVLALVALQMLARGVCAAQDNPGAAFAVSDGKGQIQLLWFPPGLQWPAGGWRVTDSAGKVVAPHVAMGDAAALAALSVEDADTIRRLPDVLNKPPDNAKQQRNLVNLLGLRAFSDVNFARALGLVATVANAASGARTYTAQGLDALGNPTTPSIVSASVDGSQATPLPPAPDGVQAKVDGQGVSLSWNPPAENRALPAISVAVERNGSSISVKPFVVGTKWNPKVALVVDRDAQPNAMASYKIYAVDSFGRRSQPAGIRIFFPDFRALAPPATVTAAAAAGKVVVNWTAATKPNLSGYVVERAFLPTGPWETLMTQALPTGTSSFEDDNVRGGTSYYYRVHAVGPRGDLGPPSFAASVIPTNADAPPAVSGLAADTGQTRVRLTWTAVAFPVAGYLVERRAGGTAQGTWVRLNPRATVEPLYDDYFGEASGSALEYRVVAVALDNQEGPPSASVQVTLADRTVPGPPTILNVSGADGKVSLTFAAADPEERSAQFLLLRSGTTKDIGVVLGDPLPGTTRTTQDLYVSPGETYFYRLVAVDAVGDRSDPSNPIEVRVGYPQIPKPKPPVVKLAGGSGLVTLQFDAPPAGYGVMVERQDDPNGSWTRVAGPIQGTTATDGLAAGKTQVQYRIAYSIQSGRTGDASDPASAQ
jgi:hypothetical protein